uniref:Putative secreted protein n=1 Tax=Anopheles marajoara TaxID=58244 RepID=A0A2M4CCZ5_9DIPT
MWKMCAISTMSDSISSFLVSLCQVVSSWYCFFERDLRYEASAGVSGMIGRVPTNGRDGACARYCGKTGSSSRPQ